ncbi:Auxin efflux carrier component 1a [Bienertia sinuspersici]
MAGREARRRRILEGGQDRLALITGRKPNLSSDDKDADTSPPFASQQDFHNDLRSHLLPSDQPSVSQTEEDKSAYSMYNRASNFSQDDALGGRNKEEAFRRKPEPVNELSLRKTEPVTEPSRSSAPEDRRKGEASSGIQKALDTALTVAQRIPISNVSSQQINVAVAMTEHDRLLCAVTIAILVVLSSAGFPIVSTKLFRWILLFRPLFFVLITNITLIIRRLLPDNRKNLTRLDKDNSSMPLLSDGYAWAEEAGRALELGLMLQNLTSSLFMDCSLYATIVVFGLSLFG